MNNTDSPDTSIIQDVLDSLGLQNHIRFPTHRLKNTLDLIITEHQEIYKKTNHGRLFSDHHLIDFEIVFTSTSAGQKINTFRENKIY